MTAIDFNIVNTDKKSHTPNSNATGSANHNINKIISSEPTIEP
jgi:hypothetical protein